MLEWAHTILQGIFMKNVFFADSYYYFYFFKTKVKTIYAAMNAK